MTSPFRQSPLRWIFLALIFSETFCPEVISGDLGQGSKKDFYEKNVSKQKSTDEDILLSMDKAIFATLDPGRDALEVRNVLFSMTSAWSKVPCVDSPGLSRKKTQVDGPNKGRSSYEPFPYTHVPYLEKEQICSPRKDSRHELHFAEMMGPFIRMRKAENFTKMHLYWPKGNEVPLLGCYSLSKENQGYSMSGDKETRETVAPKFAALPYQQNHEILFQELIDVMIIVFLSLVPIVALIESDLLASLTRPKRRTRRAQRVAPAKVCDEPKIDPLSVLKESLPETEEEKTVVNVEKPADVLDQDVPIVEKPKPQTNFNARRRNNRGRKNRQQGAENFNLPRQVTTVETEIVTGCTEGPALECDTSSFDDFVFPNRRRLRHLRNLSLKSTTNNLPTVNELKATISIAQTIVTEKVEPRNTPEVLNGFQLSGEASLEIPSGSHPQKKSDRAKRSLSVEQAVSGELNCPKKDEPQNGATALPDLKSPSKPTSASKKKPIAIPIVKVLPAIKDVINLEANLNSIKSSPFFQVVVNAKQGPILDSHSEQFVHSTPVKDNDSFGSFAHPRDVASGFEADYPKYQPNVQGPVESGNPNGEPSALPGRLYKRMTFMQMLQLDRIERTKEYFAQHPHIDWPGFGPQYTNGNFLENLWDPQFIPRRFFTDDNRSRLCTGWPLLETGTNLTLIPPGSANAAREDMKET